MEKQRVEILKVDHNANGIKVTFSNGLNIHLDSEDLQTFTDLGFVNWVEGVKFEIHKKGLKKEINPLGTNIYYKL